MAPIVTTAILAILPLVSMTGCSTTDVSDADISPRILADEVAAVPAPDEADEGIDSAVGSEPEPGSSTAPAGGEGDAAVQEEQPDESTQEGTPPSSEPRVDLVFFQTFNACGCLGEIGDVIKAALYQYLPEEMEAKTVRFHSLYSDDPANQQYVRMYGSQPFDLFIVTYEGGKAAATPVRDVWLLMDDYDALGAYVVYRVETSLGRR